MRRCEDERKPGWTCAAILSLGAMAFAGTVHAGETVRRPVVARPSLEFTPQEIREARERAEAEPVGANLTKKLIEGKYDELPAAWFSKMLRGPNPGVKHPVFKPEGDAAALKEKLGPYMKMTEAELRSKIDERGSLEGDNFKMREAAYDLALAWALTQEPVYARRALIVLDRYAEVLPKWPVSGQHKTARQDDLSYFRTNSNWDEGALWTPKQWYHGDLINAAPVFKAWDLVCDSPELGKLSAETKEDIRTKILNDLLYRTIKVHLQWPFSYGNMYGHRLGGMAQCGLALGDPMIVHAVVRELNKCVMHGYHYDGSISELAPGYNRQLTNRLIWCAGFLKGYSDPEGYVDPIDGTSMKNFDPDNGLVGTRLARCKAAVDALALPTGYALAVHDEEYGPEMKGPAPSNAESKIYGPRPKQSVPRLLGGAGHAVLGAGSDAEQIQAHLHFSGCYNHDHCDHLAVFLYAQGEELYSDTGYRADSGGSREWKASTAAHNTVMLDEKDLPRRPNDPPASIHGNLVFWAVTDPECMAVEADWKNAQAKQYRRLAALVHLEGKRYYVFDLFRVNGGKTHDWMLHGPLHTDYTIESPLELKPRAGKIVEIAELRSAVTGDPVSLTIRAGKSSVRALLAAAPATEAIVGQGPAVRRPGKQTFAAVRRTGGKSLYAAVHEPLYGEPRVKSIEVLGPQDPDASLIVTKVVLDGDRTDYFLSTLDAQPPFASRGPVAECSLAGSFAHVVESGGKVGHAELVGSELAFHGVKIQGAAYSGRLLGVERIETGAKRNAFLTEQELPPGESLKGASLILTYADGRTHGYTVERVEANGDKKAILVREEPGVEITPEAARFVYFPGNEFKGPTSFRIVPCTVWAGERVPQGKSRP